MTSKKYGIDFEDIKIDGYRNINELYKQHSQLHACETLFGDWNAEVLLLAQDPANFKTLEDLHMKYPNLNPYHHDGKIKTNKNLFEVMQSLNRFDLGTYDIPNNKNCGLYYANAIWLLKESSGMSGAITNKKKVYEESKKTFSATLSNLPRLKIILTLGKHSFDFAMYFFENQIKTNWHNTVIERKTHRVQACGRQYSLASIYHTSNRGMIARANRNGLNGNGSCPKGIELTKSDLNYIFMHFN